MKRFLAVAALIIHAHCTYAQASNDEFYVFKKDWSPAEGIKDAVYFMQPLKENDTTYVCRYYQKFGPMVKQESFKDSSLTIPNGFFAWYNKNGIIDSSGYVADGKKDFMWQYFNNDVKAYKIMWYDNGKWNRTENVITKITTYADGHIEDTVQKAPVKNDTVIQVQAQFPGGPSAWTSYITHNLHIPDRLLSIGHGGKMMVEFVVDKEGNIKSVSLRQSLEWSADAEAMRLIKSSPRWIPAEQAGRKVNYRQLQSLTMAIN